MNHQQRQKKHQKQNSRKQLDRRFDRRSVGQLSRVVTQELTAMVAQLEAHKALIEAMIRVLGIDEAVVEQLRKDAQARAEGAEGEAAAPGLASGIAIAETVDPSAPLSPASELEAACIAAGMDPDPGVEN